MVLEDHVYIISSSFYNVKTYAVCGVSASTRYVFPARFRLDPDRLRKLIRKAKMRQIKVLIGVLGISSCFVTLLLYYWHRPSISQYRQHRPQRTTASVPPLVEDKLGLGTPMSHVPLNQVYNFTKNDDGSFEFGEHKPAQMIDTEGCTIPIAIVDYEKYLNKSKHKASCGRRAVFLKKTDGDKVYAMIRAHIIKIYLRKSALFDCCYRFIKPIYKAQGKPKIQYTLCSKFHHGETIILETDFINIKCFEYDKRNVSRLIYEDVYAFTKKINAQKEESIVNKTTCKDKFNVLLLGMDSMSYPRLGITMSRTNTFFKENFWLDYRGYHKVGDNTLPNVLAAFTGKNLSSVSERCLGKMDECNDMLIWSLFKETGYVTAYGEDYLRLPDTFNNKYAFQMPPTDHYMRPLFMKGETELNNKSLVCAGKMPSGKQLLDYALDFAVTYRKQPFFGVFWMNSYSHNINSRPQDADKMFENFFNQLSYTGVYDNTFVIFLSDHGLRFGPDRLQVEAYYDERLPFLFMSIPNKFKSRFPYRYRAAAYNQFRLVTPYDLFNTLVETNRLSVCSNFSGSVSETCPKCQSMFDYISPNRTCQDVGIHEKWCSCHKLHPLDIQDPQGIKSVLLVMKHIKTIITSVKTKRCWGCMSLSLKNIIRIHFYYDKSKEKLFYVAAFTVTPGNMSYEATVVRKGKDMNLVGTVSILSPYRGLGKCTVQPRDRLFCVCQKIDNCRPI